MTWTGCSPRGALVVLGGFIVHLSLGTFFTFGNFSPYLISYMRNRTGEVGLRNVDGLWVISVGAAGNSFGITTGGILDKRFGPRIAVGLGATIFRLVTDVAQNLAPSSSVLLTSLTVKKSFVWVTISYGLTFAFGMMMAYGPCVQTSIKWFPNRPTLAAGLIVSGFGGGALIFNQVITAYINPDNLAPDLMTEDGGRYFTDPDMLDRVPTCFLILGASYIGMQIIGIALITTPPTTSITVEIDDDTKKGKEKEDNQNGSVNEGCGVKELKTITLKVDDMELNHSSQDSEKSIYNQLEVNGTDKSQIQHSMEKLKDYTIKEAIMKMLKCRSFYVLWLTVFFLDSALQYINGLYKAYGQTFIEDDHFLALVGSFAAVFNSTGRPFWGVFMDRFKYRVTLRCITGGFTIVIATLFLTEHMGKIGFFVWICLIYFFSCGIWAAAPSTLARLFGTSNMSVNYGFVNLAISCASILGGVSAITLKSLIGWHGLSFMAAGMGTVPFLLTFAFNGKDRNGEDI